ncbi:MAG: hypothetical protein IJU63_00195 [Bacteroidales bacterium]|nr:hypothetical protein [Bacteroidales bacterium]
MVRRIVNQCIIFLCVLLCACGGAQEARRVRAGLDDVASYINDRPDSALAVLRGIDSESLLSRKDRARAALLHSIALDKCYVDITSDSILAPALAYYRHHGSANQRLKARYYRAVLARNAGDRDTQMAWLVEAERFIPRARDPEMAGFVYAAKRELYLDLLDTENAYENALKAVTAFRDSKSLSRYNNAVTKLAAICQMQHNVDEAAVWIDTLRARWGQLTPKQRGTAYTVLLSQADTLTPHKIPDIIMDYLDDIQDSSIVQWVFLADILQRQGLMDKAKDALHLALIYGQVNEQDPVYLLTAYRIQQVSGNFQAADSLYYCYNTEMEGRRSRAIHSEARFSQERERFRQHNKRITSIGFAAAGILVIAAVILISRRRRKEILSNTQLSEHLDTISRQDKELQKDRRIIRQQEEELKQQRQYTTHLERHLPALFAAYANHIRSTLPNQKKDPTIQGIIEDRSQFLSDLEAFYLEHIPGTDILIKAGLSQREREICYLFCLGLSGKEILSYLEFNNPASFYNITSSIRHKLGMDQSNEDLDAFLRDLLLSS